ncbi:MAG: hypothetical protein CMH56_09235 [Myxococcales bacterium]|nr:hypothetical protein [Myxococcales bacterium]|tara:strand:+ start:2124 stop:2663 length:540 start_codon:yes stop_codon:yes gene_type:complete
MIRFASLFFILFTTVSGANAQSAEGTVTPEPAVQTARPPEAPVVPTPDMPAPTTPLEERPNVTPQLDGESFTLIDALKAFAKTILMLLVVLLVAYVLLGKGLPKLMNRTMQNNRMKVLERLPLDQKRMLFLVEVDGQTYLLGGADGQVSLIDKSETAETNFEQKLKLQKAANDAMKEVS